MGCLILLGLTHQSQRYLLTLTLTPLVGCHHFNEYVASLLYIGFACNSCIKAKWTIAGRLNAHAPTPPRPEALCDLRCLNVFLIIVKDHYPISYYDETLSF